MTIIDFPQNDRQRIMVSGRRAYVVQRGDCLSMIAERLGLKWRELARENALEDPYLIFPGDTLILPEERVAP